MAAISRGSNSPGISDPGRWIPGRSTNMRRSGASLSKGQELYASLDDASGDTVGDDAYTNVERRSDARLRQRLDIWLANTDGLDTSNIHVVVERGAVFLLGTTSTNAMRTRIVEYISKCSGVVLIFNHIPLALG